MIKPVPIGIQNYKRMIDDGYYCVDKTWMMKEFMDQKGLVNLFTRPRCFGKTLTLSMLRTFFEDERDSKGEKIDNSRYFEGKRIMDAGEEYLIYMGQYPVISLSLKSAKQPSYELAYKNIPELCKYYQHT